jgi:hypothetical protein
MGRPIKKKFFANLNNPYQNHATGGTTGYGGEGVASYGTIVAGSGFATIPTVTVSAPDFSFDGAATATVLAHYKALSFATTANGTGYAVGNILEVDTGTQTTKARAPVAAITTVGIPTISNGGTLYDLRGTQNDRITFTHANLTTPLIVQVESVSGSTATSISVVQAGVWNGAGAPTSMANGVGGFTATTTAGFPGGDDNGNGLVLSFPANIWGVFSFGTVSVAGDYTTFPSTGGAGTLTSITPATGTGAKADITMGLLSVEVLTAGRGYTATSDAAITFSGGTGASATAVLTNSYQNGLRVNAFVVGGSSAVLGDIMKQEASRRYLVKTAEGQSQCKLVASDTPAEGQMNLIATDWTSASYYVTKLTAHKATVVNRYNTSTAIYTTGQVAPWTIGNTTGTYISLSNV